MNRITNMGNMPKYLNTFLIGKLPFEDKETQVWDCTYQEIVNLSKKQKLEPQVLIDRKNDRAYLCAIGASVVEADGIDEHFTRPTPKFYYALLDDNKKKEFIYELAAARDELKKQVSERDRVLKESRGQSENK